MMPRYSICISQYHEYSNLINQKTILKFSKSSTDQNVATLLTLTYIFLICNCFTVAEIHRYVYGRYPTFNKEQIFKQWKISISMAHVGERYNHA